MDWKQKWGAEGEINESENGLVFRLIYQMNLCSFPMQKFSSCKESKWEWIYFLKFMTLMNVMSMSMSNPVRFFLSLSLSKYFIIVLHSHWNLHVLNFNICIWNSTCECVLYIICTISAYILEWSHQSFVVVPFVLAHKTLYAPNFNFGHSNVKR